MSVQVIESESTVLEILNQASGKPIELGPEKIAAINFPNYHEDDVLVRQIRFLIERGTEVDRYKISLEGICGVSENSGIPETAWEHFSATLAVVIITQAAKAINCSLFLPHFQGAALYKMNGVFKREAPVHGLSFKGLGEGYLRAGLPWSQLAWSFFHGSNAEPFAQFETVGCAMKRTYSELEKRREAQR